ncbi:3-phosphoglycerate dehydrogenase [Aerococcaceae bacterium DSM 111022]|nr:3-phosphoglycerate dehydrogenase [Aerococcaceae bacterium DSM 111022]
MYHIKTYNNIAIEGLERLDRKKYILNDSDNPDGILLRSEKLHNMAFPENLKAVARAGAGTNNVPVDTLADEGIVVFNTPGANANSVKELVIASMTNYARNMHAANDWAKALTGDDIDKQVEAGKKQFKGTELQGKTLGVIGLGSIGHMVANDAYDLGMNVIGFDPYISIQAAWKISQYVHQAASLEEMLQQVDYLTIHVPFTADTEEMLDEHVFKVLKNTAVVLNFSRAELVDNQAIIKALDEDRLGAYITDFPTNELMGHDKITLYPHLGASSEEAETNCAVMAADQLSRYLETGEIINSVNYPRVELPFNSPIRLAIANRNVPNMIGELSSLLSNHGINIDRIINESRGNYAYTLVDMGEQDEMLLDEIIDTLQAIEGILKARIIRKK